MRLMIVGSLEGHISAAGKIALSRGAKVMHTETIEQALGALRSGKGADLLMVDIKLKIGTLIDKLEEEHIAIPVVACGIGTDAASAVKAIKAGAKEYIPLPPDADLIAAVLQAVTEENNDMIANDPKMLEVLKLADQIAPSDATILITGESGTGKEVISRYIHEKSKRSSDPFISLNCAAIPEHLLESELFGHEKGAFTGAIGRRIGKFEEANGGTLLLDEISEMHPSLQAKLLRVIQERVIDRIGGTQPVKVDIRIIATSNRDLEKEVCNGNFREDLYFRLNVVNVQLPSLKERSSDIGPLAQMFADKYSKQNSLPAKRMSSEALDKLITHSWPGNVRELENTMYRAILISQEAEIEANAIHLANTQAPEVQQIVAASGGNVGTAIEPEQSTDETSDMAAFVGQTVADVERDLIINTLGHCLGNRTHAANILGISIRTLRNKLKQYGEQGIQVPRY